MLQQKKDKEIRCVVAYWADWIVNLKTIHDFQTAQKQIDDMEKTMRIALEAERKLVVGSKFVPSPNYVGDSNDGTTKVQLSQGP